MSVLYYAIEDELIKCFEEKNTLPARFSIVISDEDMVALLAENLIVRGQPGSIVPKDVPGVQIHIGSRIVEIYRESAVAALKETQDKVLH